MRFGATLLASILAGCASTGPALDEIADPAMPVRVELADVPFHPQADQQCGPAALATVLNYASVPTTPAALSPLVFLPVRGGSLQVELKAAARRFDRLPYQIEPHPGAILEQLADGRPVLVLQNLGLASRPVWHFAVVVGYDLDRDELVLRSGTDERLTMSARSFLRSWDRADRWALVIVEPGELPARARADRYLEAAAGLEAAGRRTAARHAYQRAVSAWPDESLPWLGLGNLAYFEGDLAAAVAAYRRAVEQSPRDAAARNNLAHVLAESGCIEAARQQAQQALRDAGSTPLAHEIEATLHAIAAQAPGECRYPRE
ncbi:MAG TPA: PA2778 family cysteine peptidase [Steroidobacteraceae bacterium]|nr:PA2778 family cysteine peptidase [Steroidobacteraceae bacterium]